MKDYVVQAGPLRTFDMLYDPRFEKIRAVGDYHTIEIQAKRTTQRIYMNNIRRSSDREIQFVSTFFAAVAKDHRTMFGLRDVAQGQALQLGAKLKDQDRIRWMESVYGASEDDLIVAELRNFKEDFDFIRDCTPPTSGEMFFYLTSSPFDVFDIYWQRAAKASLKAKEDRFRRDVMGLANQSRLSLHQDQDGSFTVVVHPQGTDVAEIENFIRAAGEKAGMSITFAPGLFS